MKIILFLFCVLFCVCLNHGKDFVLGTRSNNLLISTEKLVYRSYPFLKREKDYHYVDRKERIIKPYTDLWFPSIAMSLPDDVIIIDRHDGCLEKSAIFAENHTEYGIGVVARDLSRTKAEVTLTEGGQGFTNVSLHFESERGQGLNYLILIFSANPPTTLD